MHPRVLGLQPWEKNLAVSWEHWPLSRLTPRFARPVLEYKQKPT